MQIRITVPYIDFDVSKVGAQGFSMPALSMKHAKTSSYGELCKSKPNKANFVYQKYSWRSLRDRRLFFNQYKRASKDTNMTAITKAKRTLTD